MSEHRLIPTGSTGVYLPIEPDGSHLATAVAMEELGYDTLWLAGGQIDRLTRMDDVLDATSTIRVASGIVALGVYGTDAIVAHHDSLAGTRPGRYVLGLGGPQQERPLRALRGYLDELDAASLGADQRLLAALGPKKVAIAAERAAGAITLMTSPESTAATRRTLGDRPVLTVHVMTTIDSDSGRARAAFRETIGFLSQVGGYRASLTRMGLSDQDVDDVSDRLVDTVTARGDVDAVARRVAEHREAGADQVVVSIYPTAGGASLLETAGAVAERLGLAG